MRRRMPLVVVIALLAGLTACTVPSSSDEAGRGGTGDPASTSASASAAAPTAAPTAGSAAAPTASTAARNASVPSLPPTSGGFDYQLGGAYQPVDGGRGPNALDVVVRDASADPLPGAYSVCYVNGFQTQPDQAELWRDHPELLLHDAGGEPVTDPDWPDEHVLDPSSSAQRTAILEILGPVITGCAGDGFDAVEIDNLDTWLRFDAIDEDGAQALASGYVDLAHESGLAIAQKNAAEATDIARSELGFDFAVAEECGRFAECADYTRAYGDHVLQIEYPDSLAEAGMTFADVCAQPERAPMVVLRDRDLVTPVEPGYRYESC